MQAILAPLAGAGLARGQLHPRAVPVAAARALLEEEGIEALSMRRIAERLGIGAPSVYKHLPDKAALEAALISAGFEELSERFEAAAAGGGRPLPRERLAAGVEDRAARPLLEATGGDRDAARAAWPSPTG